MSDFEKWWKHFTMLEPDGWDVNAMAAAGGAWTYQQITIDKLKKEKAVLEARIMSLMMELDDE